MKKVLVVDDDSFFAKNIQGVLDEDEYKIIAAEDGVEGLKKVEESKPDVILLDLNMPKMNGMEFLKNLNDKYGKGEIPVLITSNLSTMKKVSEGLSLGIRGYIVKSDETLDTIADTVETLLKSKK